MERLPAERLWKIVDLIFEENPADLYRCRAVSRAWKTSIDQHMPALYKKWHHACLRDIPEDCIDNIVASRFPLAALPWKDSYWKTVQLPHIPRTIHKTWKNLQDLASTCDKSEFEIDQILPKVDDESDTDELSNPESFELNRKPVVMNDKYLAVVHRPADQHEHNTYIYKLSDMTQPIRVYPFKCSQMDFYTAEGREFIILDTNDKKCCMMSEFLKNNQTLDTELPASHHIVVGNECFSYTGLYLKHYTFSNGCLKVNKEVYLPKQSFFNENTEIMELRISGSELLVFVRVAFTYNSARANSDYPYDLHFCIFKYKISQDLTNNLDICPNDTNFIEEIKHFHCSERKARNVEGTERLPLDIRLYPIQFEFMQWLGSSQDKYTYLLVHGNQIIGGTNNGDIVIYHYLTVDGLIRDFNDKSLTLDSTSEINLGEYYLDGFAMPIGIAYTKSKLRIIIQSSNNLLTIDFPLKF